VKSNSVTPVLPPIIFTATLITKFKDVIIDSKNNQTRTVDAGKTASFTITPGEYQISTVTGCDKGMLSISNAITGVYTYTTAGIIQDCTVTAVFVKPQTKGDFNSKDGVTIADALLALQFAIGLKTPTPEQIAAAPIGAVNGKIDIADAVAILNYAVSTNPHW
jgi:hypothetical protein